MGVQPDPTPTHSPGCAPAPLALPHRLALGIAPRTGALPPDPSPHPARSEQLGREQPDRGKGGEELLLQPLPPALRQSHVVVGATPLEGLRVERRLGALVLLGAAGGVPLGHRGEAAAPPPQRRRPGAQQGVEQLEQRAAAAAAGGLVPLAHGRLQLGRVEALLLEVRAPAVEQHEPARRGGHEVADEAAQQQEEEQQRHRHREAQHRLLRRRHLPHALRERRAAGGAGVRVGGRGIGVHVGGVHVGEVHVVVGGGGSGSGGVGGGGGGVGGRGECGERGDAAALREQL
eukprot:scaffold52648_cov64-Phaeocystis_antarctica.AAC.3